MEIYPRTVHWLDRAAATGLARTPPRRRVFRDGWGDPAVLAWYRSIVGTLPEIPDLEVGSSPPRRNGGLVVTDLLFESPARHLPPASRTARARLIAPDPEPQRLCLLMAAWNDHGYRTRTKLAKRLADVGIASLILENPLYGERREDPADDRPLATAADFGVMGRAAVEEGRALVAHFRHRGYRMGVSGFSMGGNIAGFVGATVPFPVAITPVAASHSPGPPFLHGIISNAVDWTALGGDTPETRERLADFLLSASVLNHEPPEHTRAAVLVAGTIDGIVPTSSVQAMNRHWPGSQIDWVRAGHATLLWRNKDRMVDAIVDTYERLDTMLGVESGGRRAAPPQP